MRAIILFVVGMLLGASPAWSYHPYRMISGISMGGYGAMNLAFKYPDQFGGVGVLSPIVDLEVLLKLIQSVLRSPLRRSAWMSSEIAPMMLQDLFISFGHPFYETRPNEYKAPVDTYPVVEASYVPVRYGFIDLSQLMAVDQNKNGRFDLLSDPIVMNPKESFEDLNQDGVRTADEPFYDWGLDGVEETHDFGEGDGVYNTDPDLEYHWLVDNPRHRVESVSDAVLDNMPIFMDAGYFDEFRVNHQTDAVARVLRERGKKLHYYPTYPAELFRKFPGDYYYFNYVGEHTGFNFTEPISGSVDVLKRFTYLFSFLSQKMPGGEYVFGETERSKSRTQFARYADRETGLTMPYIIYLPRGYHDTNQPYPVIYFLMGYWGDLTMFHTAERIGVLKDLQLILDGMMATAAMQKCIVVLVDCIPRDTVGNKGCFYSNQVNTELGGAYEDYLIRGLIPFIDQTYRTKQP